LIERCFATGNVSATSLFCGGFVGQITNGIVSNCYARGGVTGTSDRGGFVGYLSVGQITNCYSTGIVPAGGLKVNGFAGSINSMWSSISNSYWDVLNGKFYSTALALLPFQKTSLDEKEKTIEWLLETQSEEGCWDNGNVRNNAFLLHSLWPKRVSIASGGGIDPVDDDDECEIEGYDCVSSSDCDTGDILDYDCAGLLKCCSSPGEPEDDTCVTGFLGEICFSGQECIGGTSTESSDLGYHQICCTNGGSCETIEDECGDDYCGDSETEYNCPEDCTGGTEDPECVRNDGVCHSTIPNSCGIAVNSSSACV